jgi:hypothetical protein
MGSIPVKVEGKEWGLSEHLPEMEGRMIRDIKPGCFSFHEPAACALSPREDDQPVSHSTEFHMDARIHEWYAEQHKSEKLTLAGDIELELLLKADAALVESLFGAYRPPANQYRATIGEGAPFFAFRRTTWKRKDDERFYRFLHFAKDGSLRWDYFHVSGWIHNTVLTVLWRPDNFYGTK